MVNNFFLQNVRARATESAVTDDDASGPEVGTANIANAAEIAIENAIVSAIARGSENAIETGNVITANPIRENDHAAEIENVNVKEIVNIESEAEKKGKLYIISQTLKFYLPLLSVFLSRKDDLLLSKQF